MSRKQLHTAWANIKARCNNPNNPSYKNYGARGIKICDEWGDSFQSFFEWAMKNGYSCGLTIDRIDVNGDYCPENCRWISNCAQQLNKRSTIYAEIDGVIKPLRTHAKDNGISWHVIYNRYKKGVRGCALVKPEDPTQRRKYNSWRAGVRQAMELEKKRGAP